MNFDAFARFYDGDYRNYVDDLPLILDVVQESGPRVLELGCGTGRVLLPLAAAGCQVTGVDGSAALLDAARRKVAEAGVQEQVTLVHDDLRRFRLAQQDFDCAVCVSNTLMHLETQEDQLAGLRQAAAHLRPGGLLLVDLFNPDIPHLVAISGLQELADTWTDEATRTQVIKWCVRRVSVAEQRQETLFIYEELFPDGQVRRTALPFTLRFLWPSEGVLLLEKAGFAVEEILGDFDGSPYDDESERLIFIARKP
ncbi:MAG: class I SAM-dependent methyltransferase [Caldilineae bacterium]|nr:MAG: class I SAM-dependent methyltransferase [Caldilineae bacterium]